jgi:hypothetical protein
MLHLLDHFLEQVLEVAELLNQDNMHLMEQFVEMVEQDTEQ